MTTDQLNRETEFHTMLMVANAGDIDAQYAIANKYWEGIGTPQNRTLGYAWTLVAPIIKTKWQ